MTSFLSLAFFLILFQIGSSSSSNDIGLNISRIILASPSDQDSSINFLYDSSQTLLISLAETGSFVIKNQRINIIKVDSKDSLHFNSNFVKLQGLRFYGDLYISTLKQWKLFLHENYWSEPYGWTNNSISTCGGINMLGGYGLLSGGEIMKEFTDLPLHSVLRIVASYHFIDAWSGETGFMRVNNGKEKTMEYVWTERHDFSKGANVTSICGAKYPENKLTATIDLTFPHHEKTVVIGFGSTLDLDPFENSFGMSNLQIYLR